jgi:flagellar hook-length control protein FliK
MLSQVQGAIRMAVDGNDSHVTLQLNPPELGKVVLKLQSDGGEISGVLEAENPWTLQELRREASTLTRNLADNGVQVKQLDIVQHQAPANNSHAFTQSQDGGGWANQDAAWQFAQRDYVPANTPETAEPALAAAGAGVGESYITDSSVNLWI